MKTFLCGLVVFCGVWGVSNALASDFASFYVDTENGAAIESQEVYVNCLVSVGDLKEEPAQIKGRGHSSWLDGEKKAYRLKFGEKQNPMGMGRKKERDWILVANHFDKSLLRNYTAFLLASRLDGLDATVSFQNIHLYLNNEYMGVYLLCERIESNSCGMMVSESKGGFLLELDTYSTGEGSFIVYDETYAIQSDYQSQSQVDDMWYFLDGLDIAISQEDEVYVREYMDVDSWIDAYLVQEFMLNRDVGFASFYLYREHEEAKLFAGPVWDLDLSSGNDEETYAGSHVGLYAGEIKGTLTDHPWFAWLMGTEWFTKEVYARWQEISPIIDQVILDVEALAAAFSDDFARNFERWPILGLKTFKEPDAVAKLATHPQHVEYLSNWLRARKAWLDGALAERVMAFEAYE